MINITQYMPESVTQFFQQSKDLVMKEVAKYDSWRSNTWNVTADMNDHEQIDARNNFARRLSSQSDMVSGAQSMKMWYETSNKFFNHLFFTTFPQWKADLTNAAHTAIDEISNGYFRNVFTKIGTFLGGIFGPIFGAFHGFSVAIVGILSNTLANLISPHVDKDNYRLKEDPNFETAKTVVGYVLTAFLLHRAYRFVRNLFARTPEQVIKDLKSAKRDYDASKEEAIKVISTSKAAKEESERMMQEALATQSQTTAKLAELDDKTQELAEKKRESQSFEERLEALFSDKHRQQMAEMFTQEYGKLEDLISKKQARLIASLTESENRTPSKLGEFKAQSKRSSQPITKTQEIEDSINIEKNDDNHSTSSGNEDDDTLHEDNRSDNDNDSSADHSDEDTNQHNTRSKTKKKNKQ